MPMRAVLAGIDSDGGNVYVGRAKHDGTLMPGKVVSTHKACYVACGDQERAEESYQVSSHSVNFDYIDDERNHCCYSIV